MYIIRKHLYIEYNIYIYKYVYIYISIYDPPLEFQLQGPLS